MTQIILSGKKSPEKPFKQSNYLRLCLKFKSVISTKWVVSYCHSLSDKQEQSWHISDRSRCMPSCSEHAQCTCGTMIGEYRCVCKPGYEGNGETCTGKYTYTSSFLYVYKHTYKYIYIYVHIYVVVETAIR